MKYLEEFKKFALKGNVIDLAVGVIIGGAFGKIVTSLVNDIIMPPIGVLLGGMRFSELSVLLKKAEGEAAAVTWNYGAFLQNIVDFLLIAVTVFIMVKAVNKLSEARKKKETEKPAAKPEPTKTEALLTEIRDLLSKK